MDKKELINKLILDLAQDAPMSQVMLMAQAVSFELQINCSLIGFAKNREVMINVRTTKFHPIEKFLAF